MILHLISISFRMKCWVSWSRLCASFYCRVKAAIPIGKKPAAEEEKKDQ